MNERTWASDRGEMAKRIRWHQWSATPLGAIEGWPPHQKTLVEVMLSASQPMFIVWGPARTLLYNDAYAEILANKHPAALGRDFLEVWHEIRDDLVPIVDSAYAGQPVHMNDIQLLMLRRGYPEETHFSFSYTPFRDVNGTVSGFFCPCTEITRQVLAERALRETEERLSLALEVGGVVGAWDWDILKDVVRADSGFAMFFGVDHASVKRGVSLKTLLASIHPEDRGRVKAEVIRVIREGGEFAEEYRVVRPDGTEQWVLSRGRCALDEAGNPLRFPGVAVDITERKKAEEHQRMLMSELDHRVRNTLAVVDSITRQTLRDADTDAADRLIGRLNALAQAHTLVADTKWQGANLQRLVADVVAPYSAGPGRLSTSGQEMNVTPKAAQALTLTLHELATNAAKYGALSARTGRVSVDWRIRRSDSGPWLVLTWREVGGPPIEAPPRKSGFGSRLIELTLSYELKGTADLDYRPTGLVATFSLPLAKVSAGAAHSGVRPDTTEDVISRAGGSADSLNDKRLLIVEDEHLVACLLAEMLQGAGCEIVGPVANLAEARRLAESEPLDCAVLDINLNGKWVWPVAETLRARGIPFVFATGYADTVEPPIGLREAPRVGKPVDAGVLLSTVSQLLLEREIAVSE